MSDTQRIYSRITRRETTSPRSALAITLAIILILICVYAVTEIVLGLISAPPLIANPQAMAARLVDLPSYPGWIMVSGGVAAALIGATLIILSITTGYRPRHLITTERTATVVDDVVIASALARQASFAAGLDPDAARVSVSRRRAVVTLTPSSGTPVTKSAVNAVVVDQLAAYSLRPSVTSRVVIEKQGKVGA